MYYISNVYICNTLNIDIIVYASCFRHVCVCVCVGARTTMCVGVRMRVCVSVWGCIYMYVCMYKMDIFIC